VADYPQAVRYERMGAYETGPSMPSGLKDKLLDRGCYGSEVARGDIGHVNVSDGNLDLITIAFTAVVIFGILAVAAIVVCLIVPVALAVSRASVATDSKAESGPDWERERLLSDGREAGESKAIEVYTLRIVRSSNLSSSVFTFGCQDLMASDTGPTDHVALFPYPYVAMNQDLLPVNSCLGSALYH